jgi:hypothetical protein
MVVFPRPIAKRLLMWVLHHKYKKGFCMRRTISEILKNLAALSILLLVALFIAGVGHGIRRIFDGFGSEDREDTTLSANAVTYSVMLSLNKTNVEDAAVSPDWMAPHAYGAFTKLGLLNSNLLDSAISDSLNTVSNSLLTKVDVEAFNVYTNTAEIDRIVLTNALQVETSNRILEDLSLGDIITVTSNSLFVALWQEMQDREIADLGLSSQIDSVSNWVDNAVVDIWENFSVLDYRFYSSTNDLWEAFAFESEMSLFGDLILSNSIVDVQSDMYSISNEFSNAMAQEREHRILGDSLGSNHVHSVELALSNRLDSVELAFTGTSNDLAHAISTETQSRVAGDATNHNEIVGVQAYAEAVSNKFDSAVHVLETNLNTKVSTNHFGDVTIHGGIVVTDNIYIGAGKTPVLTNELDPSWSAVSNTVTQNAVKGATAYGWGDHSLMGYLTTFVEQDGVALPRVSALESRTNYWNQAFGWGDHADIGYLTSELDPSWSSVSNDVTQNAVQGATAYGWGDHAAIGYLTNELDPYWSAVSNIVTQNAGQGAMSYGWGDHELAGYANTNGSIYVVGNVTATSFIGDGSQLSGVSGGVEFPELTIYSSGATTSIPFTKDYKYYNVVVTNSTDVSFDYSGIGDFTGSVLEFQIRLTLVNPADAVTIPADGIDGIKYVGDIDISATQNNTVQHLGMMMYSTNKVLLSHWFFDEP